MRFGTDGAIVHMKGRGDYISVFLFDLPSGGTTTPQRHLYEEIFYVISGYGAATVEDSSGNAQTFEFGPHSMFSPPLNSRCRIFNGSGRERARIASTNNLPMMMNAFRNERFVFENAFAFTEREGRKGYFGGEGTLVPTHGNRQMWETNFIPDLTSFKLNKWNARGAGSANMVFCLAEGTMPRIPRKCRSALTRRPIGTGRISMSSSSAARAIRCSGTRARTTAATIGIRVACSRRPT